MKFQTFEPRTLARIEQTKLMNGLVVPRPIAWVSTIGSDGVNLAPFSYFNIVAVDPAMVMFSVSIPVGARAGTVKDTLRNIDEVPEFVVHLVEVEMAEKMNRTAAELPSGVSEAEQVGLTTVPSTHVRPPRIAEAAVQMECRVAQELRLGQVPYRMILGEVLAIHVQEGLVNARFHVDQDLHRPIGRLGGYAEYATTRDRFTIHR